VAANAQVSAELVGARQERAGLGAGGEVEHLRHIGAAKRHRLRIGRDLKEIAGHLDALASDHHLPVGRRRDPDPGQRQQAPGPDQTRGVPPIVLVRLVGQGQERTDINLIAQHVAAPLREPGVRTSQRREHRIIERMRHRHRLSYCCQSRSELYSY